MTSFFLAFNTPVTVPNVREYEAVAAAAAAAGGTAAARIDNACTFGWPATAQCVSRRIPSHLDRDEERWLVFPLHSIGSPRHIGPLRFSPSFLLGRLCVRAIQCEDEHFFLFLLPFHSSFDSLHPRYLLISVAESGVCF